MTRLRQRLASWLLDLVVRVEPVVPAAPSSRPRVPVLTGLQPSTAPGDPYAPVLPTVEQLWLEGDEDEEGAE